MSQRFNDNTKRPQPKENQLEIFKVMYFARKFSRGPRVQERALLGLHIYLHLSTYASIYISVSENTSKKLHIVPLKVDATLLSGSRKDTVRL